jgi:hypothetical protein
MIDIPGMEALIEKVGVLEAMRILRKPMQRGLARLVGFMADYPPSPAGSRYRRGRDPRSERLGQKWTQTPVEIKETSDGLEGRAGNNVSYGPFVQSEQFQARWMGHWQTDQDAVDQLSGPIQEDFEKEIGEFWQS